MAVRAIGRNTHGKRSAYVCDDDSREYSIDDSASSSDESPYITRRKNKVRSAKSIRNLFKDSHSYEKTEDHAYTQATICRGKRRRLNTDNDFSDATVSKKSRCESKNAVNARINRERKKAYLRSLEDEVQALRETNEEASKKLDQQDSTISNLRAEVTHMRSLLANNKYLCALVGKLSEVTGLPVSSSLIPTTSQAARTRSVPSGGNHPIARKDVNLGCSDVGDFFPLAFTDNENQSLFPSLDSDLEFDTKQFLPFDYSDPNEMNLEDGNVGICVHINQKRLSVEFCPLCSSRAMSG